MSVGSMDRRVALVTGASSGFGEAIVHRFAAEAAVAVPARTIKEGHPLLGSIAATVRTIADVGGTV